MELTAQSHSHKRKDEARVVTESNIAHLEAERKVARQHTLKSRLEDLVCSPDVARELFEQGLLFHSYFSWTREGIVPTAQVKEKHASIGAYTSDELGQLIKIVQFNWEAGLMPRIETYYSEKLDKFVCRIRAGHPLPTAKGHDTAPNLAPDEKAADEADSVRCFVAETESNARGNLLVYLLQNGMFRKADVPLSETKAATDADEIPVQPAKTVRKVEPAAEKQ